MNNHGSIYVREDNDLEKVRELYLKRLAKPKLSSERARIITEAYKESEGQPVLMRRAKALRKLLTEMSIYIQPWELIAGNLGPEPVSVPVYPEGAVDFVLDQVDSFATREGDKLTVTDDVKDELREHLPWWKGRTLKEYASAITPEDVKAASELGLYGYENMLTGGIGHFVPDYEKVLYWGIGGITESIQDKIRALDPTRPDEFQKALFYESCLTICEGVRNYAVRYAKLARELSDKCDDPARKRELAQLGRNCERVPEKPAETFWEALQSVWFTHVVCSIDSNGYAITLGRFDQYLYPYYRKDIEQGKISKDEATRMLISFWLKCSDIIKLYSNGASQIYAGFPVSQAPEIGGLTPSGEDATNELSELILEVDEKVKLPQPDLAVLWTTKMKDEFITKAVRAVVKNNKPKFFNMHKGIQALIHAGVPLEEARKDWVFVGCVENSVRGKTWGWHNAGFYNLGKCLELALNNGIEKESGVKLGARTGDPLSFRSFADLLVAFKQQATHCINKLVNGIHAVELGHREMWPEIWESILIDDCLDRGCDVHHGGARYNYTGIQAVGVATVVDSLMAIKELVFKKKEIEMVKLLDALNRDFADDEMLRQKLLNRTPKYGNDIDEADRLMCEITSFLCDEVETHVNMRGGKFIAGFYTNASQVYFGKFVGATPDGRKAGEPLSDACSPAHGADVKGATAVICSAAKLPSEKAVNGMLLNMKFDVSSLNGEVRLEKFAKYITTFMKLGGFHVQFNIIDPKILIEAQEDPSKYPNLMVRVAAYVALWNCLSKKTQDEIIKRSVYNVG